jgi:hypothetical protein
MVALGVDEHLGLVLEAPERLGMEDPVAVALERRPEVVGRLRTVPAAAVGGAERGGCEPLELLGLADLAGAQDEGWDAQVLVSTGVGRV